MLRSTPFQCVSLLQLPSLLSIGAAVLLASPRAEALGCFDHSTYSSWIEVDDFSGTYTESLFLDDFLYVAAGTGGLRIFDISDPDQTIYSTGTLTDGDVRALALFGSLLAIANGPMGLSIFDSSHPEMLQPVSSEPTSAPALGIALGFPGGISNHLYAFVACGAAGLVIVDCANLQDPVTVATFDTPGTATEVLVQGGYAFVADNSGGLRVVDISDPTAPKPAGDIPNHLTDLALDGATLYAVGSGLNVIDISDPENPVHVWSVAPGSSDVKLDGDRVYTGGPASINVFDRSNSAIPPVLLGSIPTASGAQGVSARGDRAYASTGTGGVETLRVTDSFVGPSLIPLEPGFGTSTVVEGNRIYVMGSTTVRIYDNSGGSPVLLGTVPVGGPVYGIDVENQFLYSVSLLPFRIHDVSDPASPQLVASLQCPEGWFGDVDVQDGIAYLCGSELLMTVDVSNPASPVVLGQATIPSAETAWALEAAGDFVYLAIRFGPTTLGLRIYDVSNPTAPASRGVIAFPGPDAIVDLAVSGSTVYFASETMSAPIIDVSDPDHPILIGTIPSPGPVFDVAVQGSIMAVAGSFVTLADITDPSSPEVIGVVPSVTGASSVSFHETSLVLTGSFGTALLAGPCPTGVAAPDIANPSGIVLGVFPNPLRGSGTHVAFDIPRSPALELSIIDVAGRRVRTLLRSVHAGGPGSATWDACDHSGERVAPGVYFVRLESAAAEATRKIVVTR